MLYDRPILSILIASLRSRGYLLNRLLGQLKDQRDQLSYPDVVQFLVMTDDGETPVGVKRNALMASAVGTNVAYVDDDDSIAEDYLSFLVDVLYKQKPDVVQLNGIIKTDGGNPMPFTHSIRYREWSEDDKGYYRPPGHLSPMRRDIASQFLFPPVRTGEDYQWSVAIQKSKLLRKEVKTDRVLYFYDYKTGKQ